MSDCEGCELAEIQRVLMCSDIDVMYRKMANLEAEIRLLKAVGRVRLSRHKEQIEKAREAFKKLNSGETK